jgi:hypothetical protein
MLLWNTQASEGKATSAMFASFSFPILSSHSAYTYSWQYVVKWINNKFSEDISAYSLLNYILFIRYYSDQIENTASSSSSIFASAYVAEGASIPSRCLATVNKEFKIYCPHYKSANITNTFSSYVHGRAGREEDPRSFPSAFPYEIKIAIFGSTNFDELWNALQFKAESRRMCVCHTALMSSKLLGTLC